MIKVINVSKEYILFNTPLSRLRYAFFKNGAIRKMALQNISFYLEPGSSLGVIGPNGAGKSTLLRLIAGISRPDHGTIHTGRVTGILDPSSGFHPDMSARKNIKLNAYLHGMSAKELTTKIDEIIAFSELAHVIDHPLRTFSTGMMMRLGFSIAIHANPDTFVIDEVLAVGDIKFQQKSIKKIKEFQNQGGSVLFVTHDLNALRSLCDRALLLHQGEIICNGSAEDSVNAYYELNSQGHVILVEQKEFYGSGVLCIKDIQISPDHIASGRETKISFLVDANQTVDHFTAGIMIRDAKGQDVFGTNTYYLGKKLSIEKGQTLQLHFILEAPFAPGDYSISISLHEGASHTEGNYFWKDHAAVLHIHSYGGPYFIGSTKARIRVESNEEC